MAVPAFVATAGKLALKKIATRKGIELLQSSAETKILIIVAPFFFLMLIFMIIVSGFSSIINLSSSYYSSPDKLAGAPSSYGFRVAGEHLETFQQAQDRYGVSWAILCAIALKESTVGTYPVGIVSSCGAVGFMQFMPKTWSGETNPYALADAATIKAAMGSYGADNLPPPNAGGLPYDTDPVRISEYGGRGLDGDGDGYADPYNPVDAIFSAAKMLRENIDAGSFEAALYHYGGFLEENQSAKQYVMDILSEAERISEYQLPLTSGIWPTAEQWPITAKFKQLGMDAWGSDGHDGIDIGCPSGTPLFSVFDGRVIFAGSTGSYGGTVVITDLKGTEVRYAHMSEIFVGYGDIVEQRQPIGLSGNTGRSTGPHLHLEVKVDGQLCDPATWLDAPGETDRENY